MIETYEGLFEQLAQMIDDGILFIHADENSNEFRYLINVNDVFVPGADAEVVPLSQIGHVCLIWKHKKHEGLIAWVADKRGIKLRV